MFRKLFLPILLFMTVASCSKSEKRIAVAWETAGSLPSIKENKALGVAGPVSGFVGGQLLIAGGANFPEGLPWEGGGKKYYDDVYLFDPIRKSFFTDTLLKLPHTLAYAGSATVEEGIYYAGGENEDGVSNMVFLLQWNGAELSATSLPVLPIGVTNASLHFHNDALYMAGGETAEQTSDKVWRLSLKHSEKGWEALPNLPHPASHAVQLIVHSKGQTYLYVIGGRSKNSNGISTLYNTVSALNMETLEWEQKASLPYALAAGSGVVIPSTYNEALRDQEILLFGGDKGVIFTQVETLIAHAETFKGEARDSLIREKNYLQTTHPGFSKEMLFYRPDTDEWKILDEIPFAVPVTTAALYREGKMYITSGEIRPGVRTPLILEGTILSPTDSKP